MPSDRRERRSKLTKEEENTMKKLGIRILALALMLCMMAGIMPLSAMAEGDAIMFGTANWPTNNLPVNNNTNDLTPSTFVHEHTWGPWEVTKEATCTSTGEKTRTCTTCREGKETETIPKKDHSWGGWMTTKEATCKEAGTQTRTCSVCGTTDTQSIPRTDHKWGAWKTVKEATCSEQGKRQHRCAVCGELETKVIKKTMHTADEWVVIKEPTCKTRGQKEASCVYCGKKMHEELPKVDHEYGEWEVTKEPTDFSKGKRHSACRFCGKKKTEDFYPDGTLAKDLDNDPAAVKELQGTLAAMGMFSGKTTGKFDKDTVAAVKRVQRELKHKQDGIAWPGLLKILGLLGKMGKPIKEGGEGAKLTLDVEQVSAEQTYYGVGDEIEYKWTLTNAASKSAAKNLKVYWFSGLTPNKKSDTEIDAPADLAAGESVSGTYTYIVTKKDALAGKFTFGFIARGKMGGNVESNKVLFVNAASAGMGGTGGSGTGSGGWTPPSEEEIKITKSVKNSPKGLFFVTDETIQWEIAVTNSTSSSVKNVILTDALFGTWKKTIPTLSGGATKKYTVEYKVKTGDLTYSDLENTALVSYTGADGKQKLSKATAKAPVGKNTDALYIAKTEMSAPANGKFYVPGEEVTFEIAIQNPTTRTFTDIEIYDWLESKTKPIKKITSLAPSKSATVIFKTKATYVQAKHKKMINTAQASYKDPDKTKRQNVLAQAKVPCGFPDEDGVLVTKTVISTPANGKYYQDGEEIRYLIEVANNTEKDIQEMDIRDSLAEIDTNGYRTIHTGETLKAGETFQTHFTFVVGPYDVENTVVTNMADAYWTLDKKEYFDTYSEPVTVPTAEETAKRKPKPVALEGDACETTLTAVGDGVTQRDLSECKEHAETAEAAGKLLEEGRPGEAKALWEKDIDELYKEWEDATEGEQKRIAENEQAAFSRQAAALEASMALVCDAQTAETIAMEERMDKVVGLCYELHAAPESRPDRLEGTHSTLAKSNSSDECARSVTYSEAGAARFVDDQCENHTLTMQLTQYLLDIAADDSDRELAWLRAQGNWLLELNSMYDTWYLSADAEQRTVIAADRMAFDDLINARREALAELYPDDPATAAEVLANMIMNRTVTVCRVLHEAGILKD